jgi:hypothetical protein
MKPLTAGLTLVCLHLSINAPGAFADRVTLKTGEIMEGTILSETDSQVSLQMANQTRTIIFTRVLQKSDINSITRDTPEQKAQQIAYTALDKYRLYPSQELTAAEYNQGIDAFQKFLSDYPDSIHARELQAKLTEWKTEATNLQSGKVKFAGKWMIPEEKRLRSLQKQILDLQAERSAVLGGIAAAEGKLAGLRTQLNSIPRYIQEPIYDTRLVGKEHYSQTYFTGQYRTKPNPELNTTQAEIVSCEQGAASGRAKLANIDAQLRTLGAQIPQAQAAYQAAPGKSNEPLAPIALDLSPPPHVNQPPENPWDASQQLHEDVHFSHPVPPPR